jgi:predicted dehydrogenase
MPAPHVLKPRPRAALIGGGFIGPVHAEALRRIGVDVVGLLGSSPERARPLADRLGIDRVYTDLDDLLGDGRVEVVHAASPSAAHHDQVRALLLANRHVICEKPLAVTSSETAALSALAAARPELAAAVNYNVRYYPLCHEMRERVARGDIGRVLSVTGSYTQDWLLDPNVYNWRVEADGASNLRAVADIGTHWMDLAQFVVGAPIRAVMADLATFHPWRRRPLGSAETFGGAGADAANWTTLAVQTDDYGAVLFTIGDGARGLFHVSQVHAGRKNRLTLDIAGTEGALSWDSESPNRLWIGRGNAPNLSLERDPALLAPGASAVSHYPGGHAEGFADTFKQLFLSVYETIASGQPSAVPYPTFEDGHRELLLCEAIAQSAAQRQWVTLGAEAEEPPAVRPDALRSS